MVKSLLLVGVGGQGTILVSKILSQGLVKEGYDVKMSEIHGMSQRGGSVTTQIRFGEKVYSPSIGMGEADVLVAFEKLEAARYIKHLKKDGILVVNNEEMYPLPVLSGLAKYPDGIIESLKDSVERLQKN
jgi:indolepyruvate ferredoxin oxidoreductase beta subunit